MLALFERYPLLNEKLPHVSLGEFPTPVDKLDRLGHAINARQLSDTWIQSRTCMPSPYTGIGCPSSALAMARGMSFSGNW